MLMKPLHSLSMPSTTAIRGMLRADILRLLRDRFLIALSIYIFAVTLVMRWFIPQLTRNLAAEHVFDLAPYHPLLISYIVIQLIPWIPGIVGGFLLLESREDGTVKALLVSPNPLTSYVTLLSAVMFVSAAALVVMQGIIIAVAVPPWSALVAVGLAAASAAPILALVVAAIANNKVQAFAYMKLFGFGPMFALAAYFVPEPFQWIAAIYPPFCACKAYWIAAAGGGEWPIWIAIGFFMSAIWFIVLQQLFLAAARR